MMFYYLCIRRLVAFIDSRKAIAQAIIGFILVFAIQELDCIGALSFYNPKYLDCIGVLSFTTRRGVLVKRLFL